MLASSSWPSGEAHPDLIFVCFAICQLCLHWLGATQLLELADKYEGVTDVTGDDYNVEAMDDGPNPFRCFLDVVSNSHHYRQQGFCSHEGSSRWRSGCASWVSYWLA